ncbi:MAG TPA: tRNA 2-thiouridine(34) synthase MnmA, partial [Planctomycetaceae bacterium]|nr:tRNA 2-thiouridine(34) synthase MnmA [Planctomycetaceae bacterium]
MPRRIVLAMSGGVDSSAAAVLLQRQGYEVVGLFMRSGATDDYVCHTGTGPALPIVTAKAHKQGCCSASDAADARRVADALDIPFHALNFQDAFGRIKDYFADEYLAGRTPNPCVMCNNWLKFGKLWEFAQSVGADAIATGHYARLIDDDRGPRRLIRGRDPGKDQSYVLFGIARELLDRIVFPVGDFLKPAIRELAAEAGLRVATKPDSQEICCVPDNDYAGFL